MEIVLFPDTNRAEDRCTYLYHIGQIPEIRKPESPRIYFASLFRATEHTAILEAIKKLDPDEAERVTREHTLNGLKAAKLFLTELERSKKPSQKGKEE